MGNRNWMRAREALLASDAIPGDLDRLFPICTPGASDSASFDEVLELLHMGGRSLPHAVLMMIPEAWENHTEMEQKRRDFYRFHSATMEPWDGPACVVFTDGTMIGATLDRNGLRPSRYYVTKDDLVIMASEAGVLPVAPENVAAKGRLQPGHLALASCRAAASPGQGSRPCQSRRDMRYSCDVMHSRPWRWVGAPVSRVMGRRCAAAPGPQPCRSSARRVPLVTLLRRATN